VRFPTIVAAALVCAAVALASRPTAAARQEGASERIRSFSTEIDLERKDAFTVAETIDYDFGTAERHGIFRRIPVRYGRGVAADYSIAVDIEEVDDGRGRVQPYQVSSEGAEVVVRIGDPDRIVTGRHTYRLRYRVRRGMLYFDEHDELYWNSTGTEWEVPIDEARTAVRFPGAVAAADLRLGCFTGPQGAAAHDCSAYGQGDGAGATFETTRPLGPREGMTIVLGLPKGAVDEPSPTARVLSRALDWWNALYLLPLGALVGMSYLWARHGRDPARAHAITVRYEPPAGMTPAEMGTLLDESADMNDMTATILDLAVRGHLRIEEQESTRFLFLTNRDYQLVRLPSDEPLAPFEGKLLDALLAGRGSSVRVSELKNQFHKKLSGLEEALYQAAIEKLWFTASPHKVRTRWRMGGMVLGVAAVLVLVLGESLAHAIPLVLATVVVLGFGQAMPRRTARGRQAYEEILGFKEFLLRVDRDRLARSGGRTGERFERVLPYAIVLGAADEWANAFADVYTKPPDWYSGSRGSFDSRAFVSNVGHSLRTISTAMASRPNSGGSGKSGFRGGASGGGFGGGGGGSW
jgi:uncharacterized membrane protein YgcG